MFDSLPRKTVVELEVLELPIGLDINLDEFTRLLDGYFLYSISVYQLTKVRLDPLKLNQGLILVYEVYEVKTNKLVGWFFRPKLLTGLVVDTYSLMVHTNAFTQLSPKKMANDKLNFVLQYGTDSWKYYNCDGMCSVVTLPPTAKTIERLAP